MRIPADALIAREKLTHYLLAPRPHDDKAGYLAQAGFAQFNPDQLERAIRELIATNDAVEDGESQYGIFYRVEGSLIGPDATLEVVLIWMLRHADGTMRFVTLKPRKERKS